jgi:hypothetical protein
VSVCYRCQRPVNPNETTATMTFYGRRYRNLHPACAREMREQIRELVIEYVHATDRLAAEVRSLRIAAAVAPDGLIVRDGVLVSGWAY